VGAVVLLVAALCSGGAARPAAAGPRSLEAPRSDFNGDGFADLAVGIPYQEVGGEPEAGAVLVLYGSEQGLSASGHQLFTESTAGMLPSNEPGGWFGRSLTVGDFNGDGYGDLAVGAAGLDVDGFHQAGAFFVLYGSPDGLSTTGGQYWTLDSPGIPGRPFHGDDLGDRLAAGNFGRGPQDDLAVSMPNVNVGKGKVLVLYGSPSGLNATASRLWDLGTPGVKGHPRTAENFGTALAVGNFGRGPYQDLAIGSDKRIGQVWNTGAVNVLFGSPSGLTAAHSELWTETSPGVGGRIGVAFDFGSTLAAGNFGRGPLDDLAIGAPGETVKGRQYAGAVHVLFGSPSGLSATRAERWTQPSVPGAGPPQGQGWFGLALAAADLGLGPYADLAVGQSFAVVGSKERAGAVYLLYGGAAGLRPRTAQVWTKDSPGVAGAPHALDWFGSALAVGKFGPGPWGDLVVTEADQPPDSPSGIGPGAVSVLYGSRQGITGANSQRWREGAGGLPPQTCSCDGFGDGLGSG
jgi:hypothetical protein